MYTSKPLNNLRILLVDDDQESCLLFSEVLSIAGAAVSIANSGVEAFVLMKAMVFDALVADLAMPDISGFEIIRQLRTEGWYGLAIAVTGYSRQQDVQQALESGFDEHLAKPVSINVLVERIVALRERIEQGENWKEVPEFISNSLKTFCD
jgi:two-component system, chemotaxis family, CheB/CheR fusion protein